MRHLENKTERAHLVLPGDLRQIDGQLGDVFGGLDPLAIRPPGPDVDEESLIILGRPAPANAPRT